METIGQALSFEPGSFSSNSPTIEQTVAKSHQPRNKGGSFQLPPWAKCRTKSMPYQTNHAP